MGHYDSDYEFDQKRVDKEKLEKLTRLKAQFTYKGLGVTGIPQRFLDNLEDLSNWLTVQIISIKERSIG